MEKTVPQKPEEESFHLSRETAESLRVLIEAAAPHLRHMQAASIEAARAERNDGIAAARPAYALQLGIVAAVTIGGLAAAVQGQWDLTEKLFIALLGVGFGAKLAR
jgi:hypothetical protein